MKKILGFLLLFATITLQSQSSFDSGFKKGFCEGYKDKSGAYSVCPVAPVAPSPSGYQSSDSYTDGYNAGFKKGMNRGQRDCVDKGSNNNESDKSSLSNGTYANPKGPDYNPIALPNSSSYTNSNNNPIISSEALITFGLVGGVLLAELLFSKENRTKRQNKKDAATINYLTEAINLDSTNPELYYYRGLFKIQVGLLADYLLDFQKACELGHKESCKEFQPKNIEERNKVLKKISESTASIKIDSTDAYEFYYRAFQKDRLGISSIDDYKKACELGHKESCKKIKW